MLEGLYDVEVKILKLFEQEGFVYHFKKVNDEAYNPKMIIKEYYIDDLYDDEVDEEENKICGYTKKDFIKAVALMFRANVNWHSPFEEGHCIDFDDVVIFALEDIRELAKKYIKIYPQLFVV